VATPFAWRKADQRCCRGSLPHLHWHGSWSRIQTRAIQRHLVVRYEAIPRRRCLQRGRRRSPSIHHEPPTRWISTVWPSNAVSISLGSRVVVPCDSSFLITHHYSVVLTFITI
jgi:hypothetical protein